MGCAAPAAAGDCGSDCPASSGGAGARRIYKGDTVKYFGSPTCATNSPAGTLASCDRFYFTGAARQAWTCAGAKWCFAEIKLAADGSGGTTYWLLDHECGARSSIVPDDNTECSTGA